MFFYYLRMAKISMVKHWGLTLLMVLAIGLGIGAAMTTITVNYMMSANPIPHKSKQIFNVQLDSWDVNEPYFDDGRPPAQLTYRDATALLTANKAMRQTIQSQANAVIEPEGDDSVPFQVSARANSADFFAMFDVPFVFGGPWTKSADDNKEQVVVINNEINQRLFGGENSVGKTLKIAGHYYQVVGVIDYWNPLPKFYDISTGAFNETEEVFVPFSMIAEQKINRSGNTNCWKPSGDGFQAFLNSECVWTQFWVELPDEQSRQEYRDFLRAYVEQQKTMGRFERPLNNRLLDVMAWLESMEVVEDDAVMMMAMSFMFLLVCMLNTVGLLLAKFLGKSGEIGIRQALGASRRDLFFQYLVESGCIGVVGGLLGLGFAFLGLQGIETLYGDMTQGLTDLDITLVLWAITLAIVSSLAAGLYPTWQASKVQPSQQLKSQ